MSELIIAVALWCSTNAGLGYNEKGDTTKIGECEKRLIDCLNPGSNGVGQLNTTIIKCYTKEIK